MKHSVAIAVLSLFVAAPAFAQGASNSTPGHTMQDKGSYKNTPGASGYAPGQVMKRKGVRKGTTGASGYTPAYKMKHPKSSAR
jgi:hypothetical protein